MEQEHENNISVPSWSSFNQNGQGQQQQQSLGNQYQCSSVTFQQDQSSFNQYQLQASYNNNNPNGFNIFGQVQQQHPQEFYQQPYQNRNIFGSLSGYSQPNLRFLQNGLDFSHAASQLFPPSHTPVMPSQLYSINNIPQGIAYQNLTCNSNNSSNNSQQQLNVLDCNAHDEDDDGEFNPGEDDTNADSSSTSSDTNCDGGSSSEGNHDDDANFNLEEYLRVRDQL